MLYLLQIIIYTGLMLSVYMFVLRNMPVHAFNRIYLLLTVILPFIIPFIKLPDNINPVQGMNAYNDYLPELVINAGNSSVGYTSATVIVPLLYVLVVMLLLIKYLMAYRKLRKLIQIGNGDDNGRYVILKNTGYGPGSWGRYILLPQAEVDEQIIQHELVHIDLKHSWDILFINLLQVVCWPNVFIHFIKKELEQVHEFQADARVATDSEAYSHLLLSSVFDTKNLQLTHSFINHPIKRRIMMLYKNSRTGTTRKAVATLFAVALIGGIVTIQSCAQKQEQIKPLETKEDFAKITKMPEPGYNIYEYLGANIKYPEGAKERGVEGRIAVRFVVDVDGKITKAEISSHEYDEELGKAALDVVSGLPAWEPGEVDGKPVPVYYTLPIMFKMDDVDKDASSVDENLRGKEFHARMDRNASPEVKKQAEEARQILKEYNDEK